MSLLVCPLCGKSTSIKGFNPSGFDSDIYVKTVRGLGRGKGFVEEDRHSILHPGNPTVELIKDRFLEISRTLLDNNCLNTDEVLSSLRIKVVDSGEIKILQGRIRNVVKNRNKWRTKAKTLEVNLENLKRSHVEVKAERNKWRTEVETLDNNLEEVTRDRNTWRNEAQTLEVNQEEANKSLEKKGSELEDLHGEIRELIEWIEETVDIDYDYDEDVEDAPLEVLKGRVQDLINEYDSLVAEAE